MNTDFDFSTIGLDNRDKRVYEALAEAPRSSLRQLAEITGINRGSIYESIKSLASKGLVGSIEVGKQRRYTCTNPQTILELVKEYQQQALAAEQLAAAYIAHLPKEVKTEGNSIATVFEDHEGVAAVLRDVIATCQKLPTKHYRVISTKKVRAYIYHNFPNFTQRRISAGISVNVIAVGEGGSRDALSERRWLKAKRGEGPNCYTLIYGHKTALITMDETNFLSAIVIDNAGIANLQKEVFDNLWSSI